MKRSIIVLFIGVMFLVGCNALKKLTQFRINYNADFTIPSTIGINIPLDILTPEIQTNISQELSNNNTNKDLIESVKLEEMTLTINSPQGNGLDFLNKIYIYINADGLSEKIIAYKENIPDGIGDTLKLDVTNEELKEYLKKDKIQLRANSTTDKLITQQISIKANNRFFVDAKILGL